MSERLELRAYFGINLSSWLEIDISVSNSRSSRQPDERMVPQAERKEKRPTCRLNVPMQWTLANSKSEVQVRHDLLLDLVLGSSRQL